MKRLLFIAALAALCVPAAAADLPIVAKAPTVRAPLAFGCSTADYCVGPTLGLHLTGGNSGLDVLGAGSVGSGSMSMGVEAGFQFWNGSYFLAGTIGADRDMVQNTDALGGSPFNHWLYLEKAKIGMNLASAFGLAPSATAAPVPSAGGPLAALGIMLPANFMQSLTSMYVVVGAAQRSGLGSGMLTGAGMQFLISSHVTAEMEYNHIDWSKAVNFGTIPGQLKTEDRATMGLTYHL